MAIYDEELKSSGFNTRYGPPFLPQDGTEKSGSPDTNRVEELISKANHTISDF